MGQIKLATATSGPIKQTPINIPSEWGLMSQVKTPVPVTVKDNPAITPEGEINVRSLLTGSATAAIDSLYEYALREMNGGILKGALTKFNSAGTVVADYLIEVHQDIAQGKTFAKATTVSGVEIASGIAVGLRGSAIGEAIAIATKLPTASLPGLVLKLGLGIVAAFTYDASGMDTDLSKTIENLYDKFLGYDDRLKENSTYKTAETNGIVCSYQAVNPPKEATYAPNPAGNDVITLNSAIYYTKEEAAGEDLFLRKGALTAINGKHSIIDGGAGQDTISYEQVTNLTGGIEIALQDGGLNHGVSTPRGVDYGIPLDLLDFVEHAAGTNYNDSIIGSDGNNQLAGAGGSDTLIGGKGNDILSGFWINTFGAAPSAGDTGEDVADYSKAAAGIKIDFTKTGSQINDGDGGVDSIYSIEKIIGSGKDDTLVYSEAIQTISSVFTVDAGTGTDTINFSKYTKAVTYTLNGKIGITETDNFENIIGSKQADKLTGDAKNNIIFSGGGNDTLTGGAGADAYNITGTGTVTVNDTGQGDFLAIGNNLFYGAASKNGTAYNLNGYTLQKVGADLTVTGDAGTITLKNWVEGDYNISLRDAPGKTILFSPCGTFVYPGDGYGMQQAALNLAYQILGVYTPLVIDLNKNGGVELTEIYSTNARFDIDADGYAEHSGWIKPTDGARAVDKRYT